MASLYMMNRTVNDPNTAQFFSIIERSLSLLISTKHGDRKQLNGCLSDLNELDYRCLNIVNNEAVLSLVDQLCAIAQPTETSLVQNICKFLCNLAQSDVSLRGRTSTACNQWILRVLEFSDPLAQVNALAAVRIFLQSGYLDDVNQCAELLLGDRALLTRHLNPLAEINLHALECLEELARRRSDGDRMSRQHTCSIKDAVLKILSLLPYREDDRLYYGKVVHLCLRILCDMMVRQPVVAASSPNNLVVVGEILGVVQAFLFHGVKDYPFVRPQSLRPAAMNLPEHSHVVMPRCKNLKNHKARPRRTSHAKKNAACDNSSNRNNTTTEHQPVVGLARHSSDSDTSDTEASNNNSVHVESKVRLEAIRLMQALLEITPSREIFGYWSQIVATGSRSESSRVLARSVLVEPVSKVTQNVLSTLTELLTGARLFLVHAEETNHTSFITFFGTVCLMIRELHFALSLILLTERNVAVLTHALKCTAALVQGTPYERLKPGLATKLARNCRLHLLHKDPTVRVAALSVFEAFAASEPITEEILNVLAKRSATDGATESEGSSQLGNACSTSDVGTEEEEEIDIEDIDGDSAGSWDNSTRATSRDENAVCLLIRVCLENISNKMTSTPVRLQSLKLVGRLAFNAGSLVFPHLEKITATLTSVMEEPESQVVLHACRALEIMSGCLGNAEAAHRDDGTLFWSIVFQSMTLLVQSSETILREAACDCLGSISGNILTQLPRQKVVLIITILFGAVRDEESAVRAAGLRALGMLVTLPTLEDDVGYLMDLVDIVCTTCDDKNLGVRVKSAWTLANLCDCLSRQEHHEEMEQFPFEIALPKLYQVSVKAAKDSDKVKCNAVRAIGIILHLCSSNHVLFNTTSGLDALIKCAVLGNDMKVRWNACRALGLILSQNPDAILPPSWKDQVFPALSTLICDSPNFKVRTNAAWALSFCSCYGKYTVMLWKSIVLAFENAQHVPSYVEYSHRDALIQQLCLTLSHVAACTEQSELQNLWIEIGEHTDEISNFMKQFQETIVPEKLDDLIKAKARLEQYGKNARSSEERMIAQSLANVFERTSHDNLETAVPAV